MIVFGIVSFFVAKCNAQQVPNTTTFDLDTVVAVVNPTTDDLQDCFNDANADYFNPSYEGSKNSLLNFRDYGVHHSVTCPAFVSIGSPSEVTSTSLSVSIPATVAGDVLFVNVIQTSTATLTIVSTGWTSLGTLALSGRRYTSYYRRSTSSTSSGTVQFSTASSTTMAGICLKVEGGGDATYIGKNGSTMGTATSSYEAYSIITGQDCEIGIDLFGMFSNPGGLSVTTGTGWTYEGSASTSNFSWMIASYEFTSIISAPKNTFNFTGTVNYNFEQYIIY